MAGSGGYSSRYAPVGGLPLGVAILAVLIGLVGFVIVLIGVFAVIGSALLAPYGFIGSVGLFASLLTILSGILLLVVAGGLWNQELWALALAILVLLFLVGWNAVVLLGGGRINGLWVFVEVVLLVYLVAVRTHFD